MSHIVRALSQGKGERKFIGRSCGGNGPGVVGLRPHLLTTFSSPTHFSSLSPNSLVMSRLSHFLALYESVQGTVERAPNKSPQLPPSATCKRTRCWQRHVPLLCLARGQGGWSLRVKVEKSPPTGRT